MTEQQRDILSKVPAITLGFWIIKILATTLGETAGDSVTMSWLGETTPGAIESAWHIGYLIGTAIFGLLLVVLVWAQIRARTFNAWLYWATIIASTTAGTTMADFATRSLGRLHGRVTDFVRLPHGRPRLVVLVPRLHLGPNRKYA
jgi:uncharacterized membrane-anchored protein